MHINTRAKEYKVPEASSGSGISMSKGSEGRAKDIRRIVRQAVWLEWKVSMKKPSHNVEVHWASHIGKLGRNMTL